MKLQHSDETWAAYRRRMLRETEQFIEFGLAHPELTIEIPAKPVDQPPFPQAVGDWFWGTVLSERTDSAITRLRDMLRNRPRRIRPGRLRRRDS